MSIYWPSGFSLEDTSSPAELLRCAGEEWSSQSNGVLDLIIQESKTTSNHELLIVHAKHVPSNRTVTLFSVTHRSGAPYPARIEPKGTDLPNFLMKSYYKPGLSEMAAISTALGMKGETVTNEWVCDTPSEFRIRLQKVFNLGTLKADVLSLVAGSKRDDIEGEQAEESRDLSEDLDETES